MNEHEKALPAGGPAKLTQNAVKIYVISSRERLLLPLAFCFCLLLVNTLLWSGPTAGLTAAVCVWYGLLGLYLGRPLLNTWESRVLLAVNLALAATLALGSNWYFRAWNLLALLALLPVHAIGLSGGQFLPWWRPSMLWERLCLLLWGLFGHLGAALATAWPQKKDGAARRVLPLLLGAAGALALLAVLVPVLASADALFAAATADLRAFVSLHFTDAVWKALLASVMTPFLFGLLYSLRRPTPLKRTGAAARGGVDGLGFAIVLAAVAALYLLFLGVQSAGLFGGAEYLAQKGLSYAEWARSGFFQMVGVTVVNLTLLLAAVQWSRREGGAWRAVRLLSALLTAESLLLLLSAAWRMTLYVDVYGLSFKRCMTYWGMGMMAAFLLAAAWKVRRPDFRFCRVVFPLALAGWLVINCVPVDYLVAKDQVDRYLSGESGVLDAEYLLYDLSYDTLSQLERLDGDMVCTAYGDWDAIGTARLSILLEQRRQEARTDCADWRTWSLSGQPGRRVRGPGMKRYLRLAAWCLGLALAVTACGRAGRIVLPEAAEVTAIRVTAGDAVTLHTDRDWIGEFLQQAAEAVSTGMESVQDAPDQTGAVKVELGTGETPDWSVLYVYEADGICCLEQPYTGIYQGDEALWTVLAADAAPEGRNPQ